MKTSPRFYYSATTLVAVTQNGNIALWNEEGTVQVDGAELNTAVAASVVPKEIVAQAYAEVIGYNPFEDDEKITVEEVLSILHEFVLEAANS